MRQRLFRHLERFTNRLPSLEATLGVSHLVDDDLIDERDLVDLLGSGGDQSGGERPSRLFRIRPVLVVLAAKSAGVSAVDPELQHSAELLHAALVFHDLTLGRKGGKRRRLARKVLGRSSGLLSGGHLTVRALELARHSRPAVLADLVDTLRDFSDGQEIAAQILEGQEVTAEEWLEHVDTHIGALYAFCCRAGGRLGGDDAEVVQALGRYGRHLGRVMSVAEDVEMMGRDPVEYISTSAEAGRPIYPVVAAAEQDPVVSKEWSSFVVNPTDQAAEQLVQHVSSLGGIERSIEMMASQSTAATRSLQKIEASKYRDGLEQIAVRLANTANSTRHPAQQ